MSMANSFRVKYKSELLCCLDQTEVKAVEPFVYKKHKPRNIYERMCEWFKTFILGKSIKHDSSDYEEYTKVMFKDGTWIKIKMPFLEFVDAYM